MVAPLFSYLFFKKRNGRDSNESPDRLGLRILVALNDALRSDVRRRDAVLRADVCRRFYHNKRENNW